MAVPFLVELGLYVYCREASLLYEQLFRIVPFLYWSSSMRFPKSLSHSLLSPEGWRFD
ncbi:hypothetical protein [Prochlorococcus marinus]|uniref:Uncharacterized protein n=1 Tax=Prochlorococcus marinus (strain MIT 9303) TaxID=59922 RepID=A2CDH7_PROM3|nr:hypothetical protein [Prochlorococcus marinus]ABM79537.1 Hypothetical protein P9303_28071 [Prochlorococcus marinus str. MIT 9303]